MRKEVEQNSAATMTGETAMQLEAKRSSKTEIRRQDCTVKLEADGSWTMRKDVGQSSVTTTTGDTAGDTEEFGGGVDPVTRLHGEATTQAQTRIWIGKEPNVEGDRSLKV
ncbi:hypothetical protein PIB30_025991 [Stylosanthes scabra]|uniref:Uncharacterized protein n=1 Tax=Stylosanthes scabra TaxID=79078 RepID=A0ABU6UC79_9FABA|nr:hypothetical protein [Stylosanthes scabra]